jgi:hypothetical protein
MVWSSVVHFQTGAVRFLSSPPTPHSDVLLCSLCQGFVCMSVRQPGVTLASHCVVAVWKFVGLAPPTLICSVYCAALEDLLERVWKWLSRVCASDRSARNFPHLPTGDAVIMEKRRAPATAWHSYTLTKHLTVRIVTQSLEMNGKSTFLAYFPYLKNKSRLMRS